MWLVPTTKSYETPHSSSCKGEVWGMFCELEVWSISRTDRCCASCKNCVILGHDLTVVGLPKISQLISLYGYLGQPHWMGHGQHLNLKWIWRILQKCILDSSNNVYIGQVLPQLSCNDTCPIWTWYSVTNRYLWETEKLAEWRKLF